MECKKCKEPVRLEDIVCAICGTEIEQEMTLAIVEPEIVQTKLERNAFIIALVLFVQSIVPIIPWMMLVSFVGGIFLIAISIYLMKTKLGKYEKGLLAISIAIMLTSLSMHFLYQHLLG